jgi:hypothetical protein
MWPDIEKIRIYIRPGVTDFRKQINGLTLMARYRMGMDPLSGDSVCVLQPGQAEA